MLFQHLSVSQLSAETVTRNLSRLSAETFVYLSAVTFLNLKDKYRKLGVLLIAESYTLKSYSAETC